MPSDFVFKVSNQIHRALTMLTGGRIGWTLADMRVLELTTVGRKTGKPRTSRLTAPWTDGDKMVVIASAGGNEHHPSWFLNLQANPVATVKTEDGAREMTARVLAGQERTDLWAEITAKYTNYADYQLKTEREIPVVLLE